ncbi:cell division protein FtsX [Candidatus Nitrospira bockiana]
MRRLGYLLTEAVANIRLNQTTTLVAIATTAFTMACFGVFLLLYFNLRGVTASLQEEIKVMVYVQDGVSPAVLADLQARLKGEREAAAVVYISKEQALADFREEFPSEGYLLQALGENPLPASLLVTVASQFRSSEAVKRWVERIKTLPGVAQVQYNRDWIESLSGFVRYLEWAAVAIGTVLAAASVTIIGSTIRLTLYARREEIEILRLIGATGHFIRIPYLIEGAILGALGAAFSLSLLKAGFEFFRLQLDPHTRLLGGALTFSFFPGHVSLLLVAAGLLLGSIGSLVSLLAFERARS